MDNRPLGRTDLYIGPVGVGTVSLGVDYGIAAPGAFGRPDERQAVHLLQTAASSGINFFDTAPNYGLSEDLLGRALGPRREAVFATKVSIPRGPDGEMLRGSSLAKTVALSLESSLRALRRDAIDLVQLHNATVDVLDRGEMAEELLRAKERGWVRFIGASVYTEEEALAVIEARCFDTLQIAYSILDQRMGSKVFPAAQNARVGIIGRSALLKGALTYKAQWLPPELRGLKEASCRARLALAESWESLQAAAIRFCLSAPELSTVLVGVRTEEELRQALQAREAGALPEPLIRKAHALALTDERLLNPCHWPLP